MIFARILCFIVLIMGLFMIICPVLVFKMRNIIRCIFTINELDEGDFKIFIYRVGGILEIFIFTLLLSQTFTI
ncbi:MAG: hypothetical protein ACJAX4_002845 [Clostridium sp.]|jgi:hypothetical protein